jgi:voltage-gated potassium channel
MRRAARSCAARLLRHRAAEDSTQDMRVVSIAPPPAGQAVNDRRLPSARPAAVDRAPDDLPAILARVNAVGLETLPVQALQRMEAALERERRDLRDRAEGLERRLHESIERGDGLRFDNWRTAVRQLGRDSDELAEHLERVRNAYQQRVLEERLSDLLGNRRRVQALEAVVLVLVFLVLGLLLYEILTPGLSLRTLALIFAIDTACCVVFLSEFYLRLRCAESRRWFWRHHWLDFVSSIPIPDARLLRTGRVFRLARAVRVARFLRLVRGLRVILFFWRGLDKLYEVLNVRLMKKSLGIAALFMLLGAGAIFLAEGQGRGAAAVDTPVKAAWWSFATVVTGGFADIHNPDTGAGQLTTIVLVIAGMTVVGVFTATLTALLVSDESEQIDRLQREFEAQMGALRAQVDALAGRPDTDS